MSRIETAEKLIAEMTAEERAQVAAMFRRADGEVFPGIWKTPEVCGGWACIRHKRFPVSLLEEARRQGMTDEDLLEAHPDLERQDLLNAWSYVRAFPEEIYEEIRLNEEALEEPKV